jgi:hypothetical protein
MIIILLLVHLLLILKAGYFLSPELSLYPFLTKNGFLPYRDLIDQHFPAILFGPISLPSALSSNPFSLLTVFLLITVLTDILIFMSLKRSGSKHPNFITLFFILTSLYFGGNYFWLETFICFFLSIIIFLSFTRSDIVKIALGFFVSLIFLIKPTLFPGLAVLLFLLKLKPNRYLLVGLFLPIVLTFLDLFKLNLFTDFYDLTIYFNRHYYLFLAAKVPTTRNIVALMGIVFPLYLLHFSKGKLVIVTAIFFSLLAFPRFEPFHLLPSLLILIYFASRSHHRFQKNILIGLLLILTAVNFLKVFRYNYGNFYLNPETIKTVDYLRQFPGNTLYLLGGNDLIYPLSNRIPPSFTYVPSLPWYLKVEKYQQRLISALKNSPITPILINHQAMVDNIAIVNQDTPLLKYINANYVPITQIGPYQVYTHRLFVDLKLD